MDDSKRVFRFESTSSRSGAADIHVQVPQSNVCGVGCTTYTGRWAREDRCLLGDRCRDQTVKPRRAHCRQQSLHIRPWLVMVQSCCWRSSRPTNTLQPYRRDHGLHLSCTKIAKVKDLWHGGFMDQWQKCLAFSRCGACSVQCPTALGTHRRQQHEHPYRKSP